MTPDRPVLPERQLPPARPMAFDKPGPTAGPEAVPDPLPVAGDVATLAELHRRMARIRAFEELAARLYRDSAIPGFLHLSVGQEAVAVGACAALRPTDGVVSNHRGHGHCIAKGAGIEAMLAELMGRETGTCAGRGGSMHIAELAVGVYGANGIVGAGLPIAAGVAAALRQLGRDDVVVAFFGDGAVAQGAFHEALNLAQVWALPVLFLCEDNHYAEFSRRDDQHAVSPAGRAAAYGMPAGVVDGNDVRAVHAAVTAAVADLRAGRGPYLLEADTYRLRGHYEGDPERYRAAEEIAAAWERDPLVVSAAGLAAAGAQDDLAPSIEAATRAEIEAAAAAAAAAPQPDSATVTAFTLRSATPPLAGHDASGDPGRAVEPAAPGRAAGDAAVFRYMDGIGEALAAELDRDPAVWLAGVDVGAGGNVFGITRGLADRFPGRVLDTPISETAVMGLAVGGAMAGTRPVVELMYVDFLGVCFDQLLNQAAKMHFMTGGAATMGLVVRTQCGAGRSSGPQHSQSLESIFTQVPGLKVVMPADAGDAYGLLRAAIRDPDPVVFIEHRLLYGRKDPRPSADHVVPLGQARVRRPGRDVTLVTWSRMVHESMAAAAVAAEHGIEAEVVDLRTIAPVDWATVAASVDRTGRLLVVHEAALTTGVGAEIAAHAASELFWCLDAPVARLAPPFSPVPYAPALEAAWLPDSERIAAAIAALAAA